MPSVSVILSTRNSPRFLEFVLTGYARQDFTDFEVVIADDGSGDETREAIRRLRRELTLPIVHVWRPHLGYYGKMSIMNRGLLHASGEYIIAGDADVVPRHDFVRAHWEMKRPNCFLAGGDFRLSPDATERLTLADVREGRAFDYTFLRSIGQEPTRRRIKLVRRGLLSRAIDAVNISPARFSGSNASAWRADLVKVNGWDETIQHPGKDDTELGWRLWNAGVKSRHARHNTIGLHMHHGMGNYSTEGRAKNLAILEETIREKRTRARIGLAEATDEVRVER
jgi:glycosyltransferase involved in cell wall biosynthesis